VKKFKKLGGFIARDRTELNEIDYLEKLTPEEFAWYERFVSEEYNAEFSPERKSEIPIEQRRKIAAEKARRMRSMENQTVSFDSEHLAPPDSYGTSTLSPKTSTKKYPKKAPKAPAKSPGNPATNETVAQFLARGGKITRKEEKK
jgi:hypothetical protein